MHKVLILDVMQFIADIVMYYIYSEVMVDFFSYVLVQG